MESGKKWWERWEEEANIHIGILVGVCALAIVGVLIYVSKSQPPAPTPSRAAAVTHEASKPALPVPNPPVATEQTEVDASKVLFTSRAVLDQTLGKPHREEIGDCTAGEQGFAYPDDSYVCVRDGKVILLSYQLKSPSTGAIAALTRMGIRPERPSQDFGVFERWSTQLGNELTLNGRAIPNLIYMHGQGPAIVTIDMHGAKKAVSSHTLSPPATPTPTEPPVTAQLACQQAIRNQAVNRSSVDFGWFNQPEVQAAGRDTWKYTFQVSAENAYGEKVDQSVACTVRCLETGCSVLRVH